MLELLKPLKSLDLVEVLEAWKYEPVAGSYSRLIYFCITQGQTPNPTSKPHTRSQESAAENSAAASSGSAAEGGPASGQTGPPRDASRGGGLEELGLPLYSKHLLVSPGSRVQGSGFRVQGSEFRVQGSG